MAPQAIHHRLHSHWHSLPHTTKTPSGLKICVLLDFFGVACLVPLLPNYFQALGCGNEKLALISSLYNLSQLLGGVALGWLSDILPRKHVLMISLVGSAVAYGMVGVVRSFYGLVLSRILVGLVKQTMTISQAMVADLRVDRAQRTQHVSHLQAAATLSFISGPALGSWLYSISPKLPPLVAASSFGLASLICLAAVPSTPSSKVAAAHDVTRRSVWREAWRRLRTALQEGLGVWRGERPSWLPILFTPTSLPSSPSRPSPGDGPETPTPRRSPLPLAPWRQLPSAALRVLAVRLLSMFLVMSLTPLHFMGFLEARYGLHKQWLGYLTSYRALLAFLAQTFAISMLLRHSRFSEEASAKGAVAAIVAIKFLDAVNQNPWVYVLVSTPVTVVAYSLLDSMIKGIYTDAVPSGLRGTALGSVGVFHSLMGIVAPLWGGVVFDRVSPSLTPAVICAHYVLLLVAVCVLLPGGSKHGGQKKARERTAGREEVKGEEPGGTAEDASLGGAASEGRLKKD